MNPDNAAKIDEVIKLQMEMGHLLGPIVMESWKQLDVPLSQLKSLFIITCKGSTNLKKLSEDLGVTPSDVTGVVDRLVEQGLITRSPNPEDRRVTMLQATEKGCALLANLRESGAHHMTPVLARLTHADLRALSQGLSALIRALKETNEKSGELARD